MILAHMFKIFVVGTILAVIAIMNTGCTSQFGAVGGAEIQKLYNERVLGMQQRERRARWEK